MQSHKLCQAFIAMLLSANAIFAAESVDRYQKVVDRMVTTFNKEDYPGMCRDFHKIMSDALPLEKSTPIFKEMMNQYGKITKLDPPRVTRPNQAVFPTHFERAILDLIIVLDNDDKILGLLFTPHTPDLPVPEKLETVLSLPFEGKWQVFWGGDTEELNHHHNTQNQQFAFDFLIVDDQGKTHKGEGLKNNEYYAFGKKVLTPADGVVTDVIQGVRDNQPGSMNPYSATGNAVVIQHKEHEVSVFGHFKQDSILVKVGDKFKKGQVLGLCGNSGNSSEPHIHYHLQNTPIIQDGTGIKCFFEKVILIKGGKNTSQTNYSPVKQDIVQPE
jgi:hypothetical protein